MGRQIKATGKSVDEAIWKGINELGLSLDEVTIETIQKGSSGLLGIGAKPAIVLITEKDVETIDIKSIFEKEDSSNKEEVHKKAEVNTEAKLEKKPVAKCDLNQEKKTKTVKDTPCQVTEEIKNTVAPIQLSTDERKTDIAEENKKDSYEYREDLVNSNEAVAFLSDLLSHMGIEAKVLAAEVDDGLKIKIESEMAGVLIGHRGENLDAIQYLTLLVANKKRAQKEYTRISIDIEGYREKREETLVKLAKAKAAAVRANGRSYRFEPMSPYERRIIHSTLQGNSHVTTHSEGVEPHRFVVITSNHSQRNNRSHRVD